MCVWGFFLWRQSCVFFLSSCWVWGRLLLSLFWCGFCASSWGACSFPRRVLQLVTLSGFHTYLAPVRWPTPAVDVYCWVGGVLVHHLAFYLVPAQLALPMLTLRGFGNLSGSKFAGLLLRWSIVVGLEVSLMRRLVFYLLPCSSSGACSLRSLPCSRSPWGFSAFSVTRCLSFCFLGDVGWASALPFFFLCFSCSGWLAGVRWVLHPVSGCSSWGCVCSLGDSFITLFAFPYLRVGEILDCGVYGVS